MSPSIPGPPRTASQTFTGFLAALEEAARRPLGLAMIVVVLAVHVVAVVPRRMGDFLIYRQAAERALAGETPYRVSDSHRYLYAPVVAFAFAPFTVLPDYAGRFLWYLLNLLLAADLFRRSMRMASGGDRAPPGLALAILLIVFRFVDNNLGHGQVNLAVAWMILLAYERAAIQRYAVAGLTLALATSIKIFPAVLLLHLVLRREWRFLAATLVSGAALLIVPTLWWGSAHATVLTNWTEVLLAQGGHYDLANKASQSITSFAVRAFGEGSAWMIPTVVLFNLGFLAALAKVTWSGRGRSSAVAGHEGRELAVGLGYATVIMPIAWKYYFANLVLPAAILARRLWNPADRVGHVAFIAAVLLNLLPGFNLFGKSVGLQFQLWSFHFLGVLLLVAVALASPPVRRLEPGAPEEPSSGVAPAA